MALVESPSQLLNTVEWAHSSGVADELSVLLLAPRDALARQQLGAVAALAAQSGVRTVHTEIRVVGAGLLGDAGRLAREVRRADQLVLGDPFSGITQLLLPLSRAGEVVIVDDGTATIEYAACVDGRRPLRRWRDTRPASGAARRATALLTPSPRRQVSVFTALSGATPRGARRIQNTYAWTRLVPQPVVSWLGADIVGASLVETGVVSQQAYVDAVVDMASRLGATRYLAHRREDPAKLAAIARRTGLLMARPALPVELSLRRGPTARTVVAFPSTAAHTLPLVLADTEVEVDVCNVAPAWFTPDASPHARAFVNRISRIGSSRPATIRPGALDGSPAFA